MEDRRREILRASLDLFAESGFHGTSVRQIARAVGVNEATLYHYFPSKDAILAAVFELVYAERAQAYDMAELELGETVEVVLTALGRTFLQQASTALEMKLTRLMMSEGPRLTSEGRESFERINRMSMQRATELFQRMIDSGRLLPTQPDLLVLTFFAPLILWKQCHSMGQRQSDTPEAERLLLHQVELLSRALQPT